MTMEMIQRITHALALVSSTLLLANCTYNPFVSNNGNTGSPIGAVAGAAIGAGSTAALGGTRAINIPAGIAGGIIGYYVTTLRFDSGGVMQSGGQVYRIGDLVGINIPSDKLFEVNTASFLPEAPYILDSAAAVLKRYPNNNILISGNTSGFSHPRWERHLSQKRAEQVSAYLWQAGINQFKGSSIDIRKLNYVGYGNYFPISQDYTNEGIRQNSHIQITSYPLNVDLQLDKRHLAIHNIGAFKDDVSTAEPSPMCNRDEIKGTCSGF